MEQDEKDNLKALRKSIGAKIVDATTDSKYNATLILDDGRELSLSGFDFGLTVSMENRK